jgi:hypothetical protein
MYADVADVTVSQGFLARRFGCGTVFLNLKHLRGHVKTIGGSAEALRDVPDPYRISSDIQGRIGRSASRI